MQEKINTWD